MYVDYMWTMTFLAQVSLQIVGMSPISWLQSIGAFFALLTTCLILFFAYNNKKHIIVCSGVCDSVVQLGRQVQSTSFPKTYWTDTIVLPLVPARTNYTLRLTTDIPVTGFKVRF
jgi:hypothetical protein